MEKKPKAIITKTLQVLSKTHKEEFDKNHIVELEAIWQIALHDLTDEQIDIGLKKYTSLNTNPFFPVPGYFRQFCISKPGCESIEQEAAQIFDAMIINFKSSDHNVFKNTVTAEVIRRLGGSSYISSLEVKYLGVAKKAFIDNYQVYSRLDKGNYDPIVKCDFYELTDYNWIGVFTNEEKKRIILSYKEQKQIESKVMYGFSNKKNFKKLIDKITDSQK